MGLRYLPWLLCYVGTAAVACAQSSAPVSLQAQAAENNVLHLVLTNSTAKTITAVAVVGPAVPPPSGNKRITIRAIKLYDAATEPLVMKPLSPNQALTVVAPTPQASAVAGLSVTAAIFADGTSWGDQATIARITQRRAYMRKYLTAAIGDLETGMSNPSTLSDVGLWSQAIEQFQSAMAGELAGSANADEMACVRSVRGIVLANLRGVTAQLSREQVVLHETNALSKRLALVVSGGRD